jgi:hypothetical protein
MFVCRSWDSVHAIAGKACVRTRNLHRFSLPSLHAQLEVCMQVCVL